MNINITITKITNMESSKFECIIPKPHLVMIQCGECAICDTPKGGPFTWYLNIVNDPCDKSGYITCSKPECNESMKIYMTKLRSRVYETTIWKEKVLPAFNNNKPITVKRSSGALETDWRITKYTYTIENSESGNDNDSEKYSEKVKLLFHYNHEKKDMDSLIICSKPDDNDFSKDSIQKNIKLDELFMYE